jgi:hypothetical protein
MAVFTTPVTVPGDGDGGSTLSIMLQILIWLTAPVVIVKVLNVTY